jgi:hypothetical protein
MIMVQTQESRGRLRTQKASALKRLKLRDPRSPSRSQLFTRGTCGILTSRSSKVKMKRKTKATNCLKAAASDATTEM